MDNMSLPKRIMFREVAERAQFPREEGNVCLLDDLRAFGFKTDMQWIKGTQHQ